jgi:type III secretion protein V
MLEVVTRFLIVASRRGDLVIAAVVLVAIVIMIIPLPTPIVDALITINIAASVLILLVAFYVTRPVEFSSLPSVILVATLFRLSITITTSRLVLLQADAGEIVSTFGGFVIGGNIAVGLVVFLIITVAQFVVVTKGSERVAEVAARFSLDGLPGKQMSIESALRNGDIDQAEAARLRRGLEQESHLYGAMDGAMKFVKGDAIASLIVIVVNLIGGLAVGTLQHGLTLAEATETYSLLTVGDGLVAQIPALLVSVAAGTLVTRVVSEQRRDLGAEIVQQLLNEPRALVLGAVVMLGLAFIPGFPVPTFVALTAVFAFSAYWLHRRKSAPPAAEPAPARGTLEQPDPREAVPAAAPAERLRAPASVCVVVGPALGLAAPPDEFQAVLLDLRQNLFADLGLEVPAIDLRVDAAGEPRHFRIDLEGVPVSEGDIATDHVLVEDSPIHLDLLAIPYATGPALVGRQPAIWVERRHQAAIAESGIDCSSPLQVLAKCLDHALRRNATHFIGIQETRQLLARMEPEYSELLKEVQKVASIQKIAEILRRLVEENVPIRNLRLIFEAIIEWGQKEQDVVLLVEYVRMALRRQICFRCADRNRVIAAYMLERSVEDALRSSIRVTAAGTFLSIPDDAVTPIIEQVRRLFAAASPDASPVVLAAMDVRRHVRNLLMRNEFDVPVLSYQELSPEFSVQPLAAVTEAPPAGAPGQVAEPPLELRAVAGR